jgi:hypothetical protein
MSKSLVGLIALVCLIVLSWAGNARAQGDDLQSPALAGARGCVDTLVDQARKANFDIERHGVDNLILDPSRDNIQALQQSTTKCLDTAFPKAEIVTRPGGGVRSRVWYAAADRQYAWCATPAPTDDVNDVQTFGEEGSMKSWFALGLECAVSDRISDWYDPFKLQPVEAKSAEALPPGPKVSGGRRVPPESASKPGDCADAAVHWASAESIGTVQAYEDHLARFPNCAFATLARVRIAAIEQGNAPPRPLASTPPAQPAPSAKNCPAGQVRDSGGDCVRDREKAPRAATVRSRKPAPARPRAAVENNGTLHALNCSDPAQVVACATKALSTLPH